MAVRLIARGISLFGIVAGMSACGPERTSRSGASAQNPGPSFADAFTVVDTLLLEERPDAISLYPVLYFDPAGGLFVLESSDRQIRLHSNDGRLVNTIGELDHSEAARLQPTGVDRLPNGRLVISTLTGGLFLRSIDSPLSTIPVPIAPLFGVTVLDSANLLISGRDGMYPRALLHIWSIDERRIAKSFLPPPRHLDSNLVNTLAHGEFALRGNRIAAIHQLLDTLYLFDRSGGLMRQAKLDIVGFTPPAGGLPNIASMAKRKAWIDKLPFLIDLHWVDDSTLIVQSRIGGGRQAIYTLTQVDTLGRAAWDIVGTPRLLGIRGGRYYFHSPGGADARNRIVVATRAGQSRPDAKPK